MPKSSSLTHGALLFGCLVLAATLLALSCSGHRATQEARGVTDLQIRQLRVMEGYFPVLPDSIVRLYRRYDPGTFAVAYKREVGYVARLIDSLDSSLPNDYRVDTLAIDHSFENIGTAAIVGRSLYCSSSYFYVYNDTSVLRSIVFHEFGHVFYRTLTAEQSRAVSQLWLDLLHPPSLYLFRDGEYQHNGRIGGHPEDSPSELFASAFNLFQNNAETIEIRSWLLPPSQRPFVDSLENLVHSVCCAH